MQQEQEVADTAAAASGTLRVHAAIRSCYVEARNDSPVVVNELRTRLLQDRFENRKGEVHEDEVVLSDQLPRVRVDPLCNARLLLPNVFDDLVEPDVARGWRIGVC